MSGGIFHTCVKLCRISTNTPTTQQRTPGYSCQTDQSKQQDLSFSDNNRLFPSWSNFTIIFPCLANRNIVSLSMAPHHSGPAVCFCTDIFPPWLITLGHGGSKPVMNNFWMWGISFTPGPHLTWIPEPHVPGYSVLPEEDTLVGEPFPLKFRVSSGEQQKAPFGKGWSLRGLSCTW